MYTLSTTTNKPFKEVEQQVINELKNEGFGILTVIDVQKTLQTKLNVKSRKYVILGACNPSLAHRALVADPDIGTLLPCSIVIREDTNGIVVSAMKPTIMNDITRNKTIAHIAEEVESKLQRVINLI